MLERTLEPEVMDQQAEAQAYAEMDHTQPNLAFVERLVELKAQGKMLDLGTGPGDIPILLASRIDQCHIHATDLSQPMLDIAGQRVAAVGLEEKVMLSHASITDLPFDDDTFDVVFSNTVLHHIPEPLQMLAEAHRVLKQGGLLVIRDLFRPDTMDAVDVLVTRHASNDTPTQRQLFHDSLLAALTRDELLALAQELKHSQYEVVIDSDRHMTLQGQK